MSNIFNPKVYFELGSFLFRSTWEQMSGGDNSRSSFVSRQNLKSRIYFALVALWNAIDKEIRSKDPTGIHFEDNSELGKAFDAFRKEAEAIYSDFVSNVKYDQVGAVEGLMERAGIFYHTKVIVGGDSTRKSIGKEFEKFWNQYFKLQRDENEVMFSGSSEESFMDEVITNALSETIKKDRAKLFESGKKDTKDQEKAHLDGRLKLDLEFSYEKGHSLIISPEEADEFAMRASDAILPDALTYFGEVLSAELNGAKLIKIARDFKRLLLTGQNTGLSMLIGHGIRYSKAFSTIFAGHKSVQKALKSEPDVAELFDSFEFDIVGFLKTRGYFGMDDPAADNFYNILLYPKKNEKEIKLYFRAAIFIWKVSLFRDFFLRRDEETLVKLAIEVLDTKFNQLRHNLIPADAPIEIFMAQEMRRLGSRYNWLTESIAHLLTHMNLDALKLKELVEADWGKHVEDDDPHNLELIVGAAGKLARNIALQTIWDIRDKIRTSMRHRIANELTSEFLRDLKDNHLLASRNICKDVINLIRYRLLILGEENEKSITDEINAVGQIKSEDERFAKLKHIEEQIDVMTSDEQKEHANLIGLAILPKYRSYLDDAIKVQMANQYEDFRASGDFDFFVEYDSATLYGVISEFFRNLKDALDRHNHYMT